MGKGSGIGQPRAVNLEASPLISCWLAIFLTDSTLQDSEFKALKNHTSSFKKLHVTLAYLGKNTLQYWQPVLDTVEKRAAKTDPFEFELTEVDQFKNKDASYKILKVQSSNLHKLRNNLVADLTKLERIPKQDWDYQPHITLKQAPAGHDFKLDDFTAFKVEAKAMQLVLGKKQYKYTFANK